MSRRTTALGNPWTLFRDGRVYTRHPAMRPDPQSVLVCGDRVTLIGDAAELRAVAPTGTREVPLDGMWVFPGFCDAHIHLRAYGQALRRLRFTDATTTRDMARAVSERAAQTPAGRWIVGRGWPGRLIGATPTEDWQALSAATTEHPVMLFAHDGHSAWINPVAWSRVTGAEGQPGDPEGLLRERVCWAVADQVPDGGPSERALDILAGQRALLDRGITTVHNFEGLEDMGLYRDLLSGGKLHLRVMLNLMADEERQQAMSLGLFTGFGPEQLKIGFAKFFLDGALGSRTALMQEPYLDTGTTGERLTDPDLLQARVNTLMTTGLLPAMHAIGDGAIRLALETLEAAPRTPSKRYRPRIEHAEVFPESLMQLASRLDVHCSVQPTHLYCDIDPCEAALGPERCADVLPLARMREHGLRLLFGSDAPIEEPDPMSNLFAATCRTRRDGTPHGGWHPSQRLSRIEAMVSQRAGMITAGARADLVAYTSDPLTVPEQELLSLTPSLVVAGGQIVKRDTP